MLCVLIVEGMSVCSECNEPALCNISVHTVVKLCTLDVLALG